MTSYVNNSKIHDMLKTGISMVGKTLSNIFLDNPFLCVDAFRPNLGHNFTPG